MIPLQPPAPGRSEWTIDPVRVGDRTLLMKQISFAEALAAEVEGHAQPWWAHVWPAGVQLAAHALAGPDLTGRTALDLGTGSGIVGIALGLRGARVTFADLFDDALSLARENAERCGLVDFELLRLDWREPPPRTFDEVWAGDVVYEVEHVRALAQALAALIAPGGSGLVSDPRRPPYAAFMEALADAGLTHTIEGEHGEVVFLRLRHAH